MKKISVLLILVFASFLGYSQINPGQFEIRLVAPGGEPGIMRVQMRAIGSVLPTTGDFCSDLGFKIWWSDDLVSVVDIDMIQSSSLGGQLNEQDPVPGTPTGTGTPNGKVVAIGFCASCNFFLFPSNWVLNQWVTVGTINICSVMNCTDASGAPPGVTAADFQIQLFHIATPNIGVNFTDYTPEAGALPLNLISFKANKFGERDALLSWATTNEDNTSHFQVQRSFDKKNWSAIGSVGAAGFTIEVKNYSFLDYEVYNGRDSRLPVYYRLNMVDLDGRQRFSPIQSVIFGNDSFTGREFLVYPNPASNGVQVEWDVKNTEQPTALEFFDIAGKLVHTQKVSDNTNQAYVDFTNTSIQSGLYLLRIMNGTEPIEHKQIVVGQNR